MGECTGVGCNVHAFEEKHINFRVTIGVRGLWAVDSLGSGINAAWVGIGNWVCDAGQMCKWTVLETKGARQDW